MARRTTMAILGLLLALGTVNAQAPIDPRFNV